MCSRLSVRGLQHLPHTAGAQGPPLEQTWHLFTPTQGFHATTSLCGIVLGLHRLQEPGDQPFRPSPESLWPRQATGADT